MNNLFNICSRLVEAYDLVHDDEYDAEAVQTTIEMIEMELEEKADNFANMIKTVNGEVNVIDLEIKRLQELKHRKVNFIDSLRGYLKYAMIYADKMKFKTTLHSFSIRNTAPSVSVYDISKFQPDSEWWKPRKYDEGELNKTAIKDAINAGEVIPGAELKRGESLVIGGIKQ